MAPPTKKQLNRGAYGYGKDDENYSFTRIDSNPWDASASGHGYNAKFDDDGGASRGAEYGFSQDDLAFRSPSYTGDHDAAHQRVYDQAVKPSIEWTEGETSDPIVRQTVGGSGGLPRGGQPRYSPKNIGVDSQHNVGAVDPKGPRRARRG